MFHLSYVPILEASTRDRDLFKVGFLKKKEERPEHLKYLTTLKEPRALFSANGADSFVHEGRATQATQSEVPLFADFRERYEQYVLAENAPPTEESSVSEELAIEEPAEPERRTVVRSEFPELVKEASGSFPRPERDTISFEDIYMFFPVKAGDAERVGLVRGESNGSIFSPPASSSLKSGISYETINE